MITTIPLCITVLAPFVTRSSDSGSIGIDLPIAKTADGRPMIPNSHVIGKIGAAMRELLALLQDDPIAEMIRRDIVDLLPRSGQTPKLEDEKQSDGREPRRNLTASDFVMKNKAETARTRTRIAVDNVRSTAIDGMMQVIEQPFVTGQKLEFFGKLRIIGPVDFDRKNRVIKALQFVTQMGALRSVGYGEIVGVTMDNSKVEKSTKSELTNQTRFLARLRFEDVFCAGEARNAPNTYTSADYVPGGVVKGAIARQLLASVGKSGFLDDPINQAALTGDLAKLAQEFGKIRVLHAQPAAKGVKRRPKRVLPLSLASIDDSDGMPVIVDMAWMDNPGSPILIDGKAPIAAFDWKQPTRAAAKTKFRISDGPKRVLRVRTQIDDHSRAAMTSRLFGIEYTRGDEHDFIAEIDLSACTQPELVRRGLQLVLSDGLTGIGRGGAFADVTLEKMPEESPPVPSHRIVITLQSAALLRDPSRSAMNLHTAYADAFCELGMPAHIEMKAAFVNETLAGGGFFRNRMSKDTRYAPWLLTDAGSTFVFESIDGSKIDPSQIFQNGLPVPRTVLLHHGLDLSNSIYRACPYLPQNGYGEISVETIAVTDAEVLSRQHPLANGLYDAQAVDVLELTYDS